MNFIHHFRNVVDRMAEDPSLDANHVSLYIALFHHWNRFRFRVPLAIIRDDLMRVSKIASPNTYTNCLRMLESRGYLKYEPSYSPRRPSHVHLYQFDKGDRTGDDTAARKGGDTGARKRGRKAAVKEVIPELNITNDINSTNLINDLNHASANKKNSIIHSEGTISVAGRPQSLEEVEAYFIGQHATAAAAKKFYHYYEATGWKIGGRATIKNWKASASYWLTNPQPAKDDIHKLKPGNLHVATNKDYGEPL